MTPEGIGELQALAEDDSKAADKDAGRIWILPERLARLPIR
jgi:hypothetical protein